MRTAFGRCMEAGAYAVLKDTPDAGERAERKTLIAQKVYEEHGLDTGLCNEALDILEAALFGEPKTPRRAGTSALPAAPRPSLPPYREPEPQYQAWQPRQQTPPQPAARKRSGLLLVVIIWQSAIIAYFALSLFWAFFNWGIDEMEYFVEEIQYIQYFKEDRVDFSLVLVSVLLVVVPALIFTIQDWQKTTEKK